MQNLYTSTPIHNIQTSNTPLVFPGQGQGYIAPVISTNNQTTCSSDTVQPNLALIIQDIQVKLQKLDLLDNVCERLTAIERRFDIVDQDITHLKQTVQNQEQKIVTNDTDMRHFHNRISELECSRRNLAMQANDLHETILAQQTRSMKYNLIFENITETFNPDPSIKEDTEVIIRAFIKDDLLIEDEIPFQNVHRLRKRIDHRPRSIVARFVNYKDKEKVLIAAQTMLREKPTTKSL